MESLMKSPPVCNNKVKQPINSLAGGPYLHGAAEVLPMINIAIKGSFLLLPFLLPIIVYVSIRYQKLHFTSE